VLAVELDEESAEVVCVFAGKASTGEVAGTAGAAGGCSDADAIVIPNGSIDTVHFLQINTLGGAGDVSSKSELTSTARA
jgi:hypothetical protein